MNLRLLFILAILAVAGLGYYQIGAPFLPYAGTAFCMGIVLGYSICHLVNLSDTHRHATLWSWLALLATVSISLLLFPILRAVEHSPRFAQNSVQAYLMLVAIIILEVLEIASTRLRTTSSASS